MFFAWCGPNAVMCVLAGFWFLFFRSWLRVRNLSSPVIFFLFRLSGSMVHALLWFGVRFSCLMFSLFFGLLACSLVCLLLVCFVDVLAAAGVLLYESPRRKPG